MQTLLTPPDVEHNGTTAAMARGIIAALQKRLKREAHMRERLAELKQARMEHAALILLPAERAYREAERVDFGFDVAIVELERALGGEQT